MPKTWWVGALALSFALVCDARAQDEGGLRVVASELDGRTVVVVVDPATSRLLIYAYRPESVGRLSLEAVRNIEYDLALEQFPAGARGGPHGPSVREMRDRVWSDEATPRPPGPPGLVERELEARALRRKQREVARAGGQPPTFRGQPVGARIEQLEREATEARLELAAELGLDGMRTQLVAELRTRLQAVQARIQLAKSLQAELPEDHGGAAHLRRELETLGAELQALQALLDAETD